MKLRPIGYALGLSFLALACSDPAKPRAQAAMAIRIMQNQSGDSCSVSGIPYSVPSGPTEYASIISTSGPDPNIRVIDGDEGFDEISCRVTSGGNVIARIQGDNVSFNVIANGLVEGQTGPAPSPSGTRTPSRPCRAASAT